MPGESPGCYLADLAISDFAVIDHLRVSFQPGFCVITGETGAGKSVIVDALGAALGDRASSDWVRAGAERSWVEALFAFPESVPELGELISSVGSVGEAGSLFLRREVMVGRSVARVNGRAVPGHVLEEAAGRLVDVHSQGDHVGLVHPRVQLDVVDRFGRLFELRTQMRESVRALHAVRQEIRELEDGKRLALREEALLRHEVEEIAAAGISVGEEEELVARRQRLRNGLKLRGLVGRAQAALVGEHDGNGAIDLAGEASEAVAGIQELDGAASISLESLIGAIDGLETVARGLKQYAEVLEVDAAGLDEVEERLLLLADLKRKYGATVEDVLAYGQHAAGKLGLLFSASERLAHLSEEARALSNTAAMLAQDLSRQRVAVARQLSEAVARQLADLSLASARFSIVVKQRPDEDGLVVDGASVAFDETGVDQVEFLFSPNPGESERLLGRMASGGELSRVMLAVKSATASADAVPVLIFDELDQGVGGRLGHVIGEKLWQLSRTHQVLCITHLPQVAVYADAHYVVSKGVKDGRASTSIDLVDGDAREVEISLMLGGVRAGDAALQGARELLREADAWKVRPTLAS